MNIITRALLLATLGIMMLCGATHAQFSFTIPRSPQEYPWDYYSRESERHAFVFARLAYPHCSDGTLAPRWKSWQTDFPKADWQMLEGLKRISIVDAYDKDRAVRFGADELRKYPFIYAVEVGVMCLRPDDVVELREYLLKGGFLFVDDFWGTLEWAHFEDQMKRVLPQSSLVEISPDHPMFHVVFDIDEFIQVPNVGQGIGGGATYEQDGYEAKVYGMFDEKDRLMVVVFHNTDLGDAWEWAENPHYPLKYGNFAYRIIANVITYAMSH